ncbi:hypothetical protein SAMN03159511_0661 [Pseudomonas sp. NFACC19-2]|nr:hypothetical protein SAMN03159511_0661 [Pseudomonas sp. NFACC19-2]
MVPDWAPEPPAPQEPPINPDDAVDDAVPDNALPPSAPVPIAPPGRFKGVRTSLGDYARSGDRGDLRRSLGHYVRSGYGGSGTATRRFSSTASTASSLGSALASIADGQAAQTGNSLDPTLLAGKSAEEIMDAVVEAVRPVDGTQDAEAERAAIRDSLSDLLIKYPDADLLSLTAEQRAFSIERFTAIDVFNRFELDVGKTIMEKAPSATAALARLKEARDYVKECVAAAFRKLKDGGRPLTSNRINQVVNDALRETFEVFEGYAE